MSQLGISFPRLESHYARFLRFENVDVAERERFKDVLQWFVRKMSIRNDRQIVLKSPSHTARIRMLLEIWPDAKFVHIHRNPYEVFLSSRKYHDTATWYTYLQKPDRSRIDEEILTRYFELFDGFFDGRDLIPEGNFHEMASRVSALC